MRAGALLPRARYPHEDVTEAERSASPGTPQHYIRAASPGSRGRAREEIAGASHK